MIYIDIVDYEDNPFKVEVVRSEWYIGLEKCKEGIWSDILENVKKGYIVTISGTDQHTSFR